MSHLLRCIFSYFILFCHSINSYYSHYLHFSKIIFIFYTYEITHLNKNLIASKFFELYEY